MSVERPITLALLYPGDRAARQRSDPAESRFAMLFEAFAAAGVRAEPAVYNDDFADEVAEQLRRVDGVLVWCNPIRGKSASVHLNPAVTPSPQAQAGAWVAR
jgi:hypothetical protein